MEEGTLVKVLVEFGLLLGFAALVSMLVNVGKLTGIVKDGTADKWVAGANFVGVMALYLVRTFVPDLDIKLVDSVLGEVAAVGTYILGFVGMLLGSKITYFGTKGLPVIGASLSSTSTVVMAVSSPGKSEVTSGDAVIIDTARHPE